MLEGLQDPQTAPKQPASSGGINLDALYGATPQPPAALQAHQQSDDPFGLGGLSVPNSAVPSHSYGSQPPSWPQGAHAKDTEDFILLEIFSKSGLKCYLP